MERAAKEKAEKAAKTALKRPCGCLRVPAAQEGERKEEAERPRPRRGAESPGFAETLRLPLAFGIPAELRREGRRRRSRSRSRRQGRAGRPTSAFCDFVVSPRRSERD